VSTYERQVLAVWGTTESATTTTTALALAMESARAGLETLIVDLQPDAGATEWLDVRPYEPGADIGLLLADPYPIGWVSQISAPTRWNRNLWAIPAASHTRAPGRGRHTVSHERLRIALTSSIDFDVVVIDTPPLTPGQLTYTALSAATDALLVLPGEHDSGSVTHVLNQFDSITGTDSPVPTPRLRGIVRGAQHGEQPAADSPHMLSPAIPHHRSVLEARRAREYFGWHDPGGQEVAQAYATIAAQVIDAMAPVSSHRR